MDPHVSRLVRPITDVKVHKYDGSVRTSDFTSRFDMLSVQQEEKLNFFGFFCFVFK